MQLILIPRIPLTLNRPAETPTRDIRKKNTTQWPTDTVQTLYSSLFHLQHLACTKTRNQTHPPARIGFSEGKSLALLALTSFSCPPLLPDNDRGLTAD